MKQLVLQKARQNQINQYLRGDTMIKQILLFLALVTAFCQGWSGSVEGPYIVWINLSSNPAPIDRRLEAYCEKHINDACWNDRALMFMRHKPKDITNDLIFTAVTKKDIKLINKLNKILLQPFEDAEGGFDGILVYTDHPTPRLYSLTRGKKNFKHETIEDMKNFEDMVCLITPPIVRKP